MHLYGDPFLLASHAHHASYIEKKSTVTHMCHVYGDDFN